MSSSLSPELLFLNNSLEHYSKAVSIQDSLTGGYYSSSSLPVLYDYLPQSVAQLEVIQFNLFRQIPDGILNPTTSSKQDAKEIGQMAERIATYFLDSEFLERSSVAAFFKEDSVLNILALEIMASKVCAMDPKTSSLIGGLKLFLPASGATDMLCEDLSGDFEDTETGAMFGGTGSSEEIQTILKEADMRKTFSKFVVAYAKAHLLSQNPIFPDGLTYLHVLVELIDIIIDTNLEFVSRNQSSSGTKPLATLMSDFVANVCGLLQRENINPLPLRTLTDIFTEITTGRPLLHPLLMPSHLPSYLFALKSIKSGPFALMYSLEDPARLRVWGELQKDALYLFKHGKKRDGYPLFCIPLKHLMVMLDDQDLIELRSTDGQQLTLISYMTGEKSGKPMLIKDVTFHPCLYLDVATKGKGDRKWSDEREQHQNEWFDAIENQVWE